MATTTLKLPTDLEKTIKRVAQREGKTPHAWIVEALEREVALGETREGFLREGEESASEIDEGGDLYSAEEVHAYLSERVSGKRSSRPAPAKRSRHR